MTWTTANGRVDYYLMIGGIGVFGTTDTVPTGSWFTGNFSSSDYHPWLYWDISDISEEISFEEGTLRCDDLRMRIRNPGDALFALLRPTTQIHTYATETLGTTATTIETENNSGWPASGAMYAGRELLHYTGTIGSTGFSGITHGLLGSLAETHFYFGYEEPPTSFRISSYPKTLRGRRAILYCLDSDGDETPIYRGTIAQGTRWKAGYAEINIRHISDFIEKKVGSGLRRLRVRMQDFLTSSPNTETEFEEIVGFSTPTFTTTTISTKFRYEFTDDTTESLNMGGFEWDRDGDYWQLRSIDEASGSPSSQIATKMTVRYGSFLWRYGFRDGDYQWTGPGYRVASGYREELKFYKDVSSDPILIEHLSPLSTFGAGRWYCFDENPAFRLASASSAGMYASQASIDIDRNNGDLFFSQFEDDSDRETVKETIVYRDTLADAMRRSTGLLSGQAELDHWLIPGMSSDDFDFGELSSVEAVVSPSIAKVDFELVESMKLEEILTPHMALCGIAPRVIADGKIGFCRLRPPLSLDADEVVVDDATWALIEAKEVENREDDVPLLTAVKIKYGYNHVGKESEEKGKEWQGNAKFTWREGIDLTGEERQVSYTLPGLRRPHSREILDFELEINAQLISTHFAIYGQPASVVEIPCTWAARAIYCGDIVTVTHPLAPDLEDGATGMTSKLGIVIGRKLRLTGQGADVITVLFPESVGGAGIAPTAVGTAYTQSTLTLTCSTAGEGVYGTPNDLAAFAQLISADGSVPLRFATYDSASPAVWATTVETIDTGSGKIELPSDLFSTAFPASGVWVTLDNWDTQSSSGQEYAFQADAATNPTLGSGSDDAKRWTI